MTPERVYACKVCKCALFKYSNHVHQHLSKVYNEITGELLMSKIELIKENILAEYDKNKQLHNSFLSQMQSLIRNLIDREDVKISSMSSRIKEKESLSKKIDKKQRVISEDPEEYKYNNLKDLTDICGIRICTFYSDDVDKIASIIENEFTVDIENSIDKRLPIEHVFLASRKCKKRQLKMYADILSLFTCYLIWIACICGFRR